MFTRLSNSWELLKASWHVLLADKELMVFPIVSFIASLVVMATFAIPMFLAGMFDSIATKGGVGIFGWIVGFLFYVVMYFITIFSNAALVGAAMIRLDGGDPTVADGFNIAMKHLNSILTYALIAATVGLILRNLSEKAGTLGRIVIGFIGFAWNVATFLVVPVLVVEGLSPIDAIKRSTTLLKETWGEQLAGNAGIGLVFGLIIFGVICVGVIGIGLIFAVVQSPVVIITLGGVLVLVIMALSLINAALSGIYTAAVYRYATTGDTGQYFDPSLVKGAFTSKGM